MCLASGGGTSNKKMREKEKRKEHSEVYLEKTLYL